VAPWITFIMTHSIHKEGDILQIYFCLIFHKTRHHAQAHVTPGALCTLSLVTRKHSSAVGFADQCLLWQLLLRPAAAAAAGGGPPPPPQTSLQHP
jgi:hypothetical protein